MFASDTTIANLIAVIQRLKNAGGQGVALACTELPMVLNTNNSPIPVIDTTKVLVTAAAQHAHELFSGKAHRHEESLIPRR